jgi:hypothetical protein
MKWLRVAIAALIVLVSSMLAMAGERIRSATESEFEALLLGCWFSESFAHLDVGEITLTETLCFEGSGRMSFDNDGRLSPGNYWFADKRLHLRGTSASAPWPFGPNEIDCDAVVLPSSVLTLRECVGDALDGQRGELSYARVVNR